METSLISPCPDSPNCVSSRAEDAGHRVDPVPVGVEPKAAWSLLKQALAKEPRLRIVDEREDRWYLRAEASSRIFGFVDDVEFQLDPGAKRLDLRSASRVGYWDLGVNRRRIERLRQSLKTLGSEG